MNDNTLFLVGSTFQLMNAVILRLTECKNDNCDLILRSSSTWNDKLLQQLKSKNIFNNIYCPNLTTQEQSFWTSDKETQAKLVSDPILFLGMPPYDILYDKFFAGVDHISWKMLFRYQVSKGKTPEIYMFDEGIRSYTKDLIAEDSFPCFQNEYMEAPWHKSIIASYLYQPELHSVKNYTYELRKLPSPNISNKVQNVLLELYGTENLPNEPYIYMEDYYFGDRHLSNDYELFTQVANIVGKDNIIVKRHPRCDLDRFSPAGYKTAPKSDVPWEIQLMTNDIRSKVFISVSSTSIQTPYIIFNSDMHVISLEKMHFGQTPIHADANFKDFFDKLTNKINENGVYFHTPTTTAELKEVIRFITFAQETNRKEEENKYE